MSTCIIGVFSGNVSNSSLVANSGEQQLAGAQVSRIPEAFFPFIRTFIFINSVRSPSHMIRLIRCFLSVLPTVCVVVFALGLTVGRSCQDSLSDCCVS